MKKSFLFILFVFVLLFSAGESSAQDNSTEENSGGFYLQKGPYQNEFKFLDGVAEKKRSSQIKDAKDFEEDPYGKLKWFLEMRIDHKGEYNPGNRWEAYKRSKEQHLNSDGTIPSANWVNLGPNTIDSLGGRMMSHAFDPTDNNTLWAGSGSGGLWRTTSGGEDWESMTNALPSMMVSSIAINPSNRDEMLLGTGTGTAISVTLQPGVGILKSTDRGLTWFPTGFSYTLPQGVSTYKMIWDPVNTDRVYLAATNGFWVSTDKGNTWTQKITTRVYDIVINKQSPGIVYAGVVGVGVRKSTDGGNTWASLTNGLPPGAQIHNISLTICDGTPDVLYTGMVNAATLGLLGFYKTTDAGASWTQLTNTPNFLCQPNNPSSCLGWFVNMTSVSPADPNIILVGGVQFWRSTDGGSTWKWQDYLSNGTGGGNEGLVYVDNWDCGFDPVDPNIVYVFNDGGVQKSTNSGQWFDKKNRGLITAQIYKIASSRTDTNFMIGGFQDHGLLRFDNSNDNLFWTKWSIGDGTDVNIHHTNNNIVYGDNQNGFHFKSTNGGASIQTTFPINNGILANDPGVFIAPTRMDPVNPDILYYASVNNLYKTTNGGNLWNAISGMDSVRTIAIDPINPNIIYAHAYTNNGTWRLNKSTNGGTTWNRITSPSIPTWRVTDLECDPVNSGTVYATRTSAFVNSDHVKKSTDFGETWTDITNNLPDVPTTCITISPYNSNHLYIGNDLGVYASIDGGQTWDEFNNDLPIVFINDIHFQKLDSTVRVATIGRGVWKTKAISPDVVSVENTGSLVPDKFVLYQNYPNPFNPSTTIKYDVIKSGNVTVDIYNGLGQRIAVLFNGRREAGSYEIKWSGENSYGMNVSSGIYYLRLNAGGFSEYKKMVLVK